MCKIRKNDLVKRNISVKAKMNSTKVSKVVEENINNKKLDETCLKC